jgi:hypothetical protein
VQVWLSKLNGAKPSRALSLFYFCEWTGKSLDELLMLKSSFEDLAAEKLLDRFVVEADFPESLKCKTAQSVRSFLRCNYRQLQQEAGRMEYVLKKPQRVCLLRPCEN